MSECTVGLGQTYRNAAEAEKKSLSDAYQPHILEHTSVLNTHRAAGGDAG